MTALARALGAETLKLKRTLAVWLAIVAPLGIAALTIMLFLQRPGITEAEEGAWFMFVQQSGVIWTLLMLPLFVTLETALLAQVEHGQHGWKHLYALPIPRWTIYAAKQASCLIVIGLSMLVMAASMVGSGLLLRLILPGKGFEAAVPWALIGQMLGLGYLGAWLIMALHTFISLRWPSFVVACATGIGGTVAGVLIVNSKYAVYYPWALPALVSIPDAGEFPLLQPLLFSLIAGTLIMVLGGWHVTTRDVA